MYLTNLTGDDLDLYIALLTDPVMMSELGGPLPVEGLAAKLARDSAAAAEGRWWALKIMTGGANDIAIGTISVWDYEEGGERVSEMGWIVLPAHQGKGYASAAVRVTLERDQVEKKWGTLHAYPGVTNGASNAICRKCGFELLGQQEIDFAGRLIKCNHWRFTPSQT